MRITEAEVREALAAAGQEPADAVTVSDLVESLGLTERRVRDALRALQRKGLLVRHRITREDLSGRQQRVPAYTIDSGRYPTVYKRTRTVHSAK